MAQITSFANDRPEHGIVDFHLLKLQHCLTIWITVWIPDIYEIIGVSYHTVHSVTSMSTAWPLRESCYHF